MAKPQIVTGQGQLFPPVSSWVPYVGPLPMVRDTLIAIDTETRDGGLEKGRGPGSVYNDGYILGVSAAWNNNSIYVPVRHPDTDNRDLSGVIQWVEYLLRHNRCVFFNGGYDLAWLIAEGCTIWPERMEDAQAQNILLDENWDSYSLDNCCARQGIPGKDEAGLNEAAASYGIPKGQVKANLWRLPARYVGPYAEQDAVATLALYEAQVPLLEAEGLMQAYRTEIELMEVIHGMRKRGIRVSTDEAERAQRAIRQNVLDTLRQIETPSNWGRKATIADIRSPQRLADIFDDKGIAYQRTAKADLPSFTKDWLSKDGSEVSRLVRRARQLDDLAEKFIGTYILGHTHRGRIHAEIHQLPKGSGGKSDDAGGGAKTTRLAYSNPPLQQMPSKDEELAPIIRGVFLPEQDTTWLAADFQSQEPRITCHYAYKSRNLAKMHGINMGPIDELVHYYCTDPKPDTHEFTAKLLGKPRPKAKELNLSLTYRMGAKELASRLNIPEAEGWTLWKLYHEKVPWVSGLASFAELQGKSRGYVVMIDGARRHFPLWQPVRSKKDIGYARWDAAQARWPGQMLERAFAFQAGNSLVQGSAARQTKRAMVNLHKAGYASMVTLHDEVGLCVTSPRQCEEIGEIMSTAVKLVVPVAVDLEVGETWGKAKTNYKEWFK